VKSRGTRWGTFLAVVAAILPSAGCGSIRPKPYYVALPTADATTAAYGHSDPGEIQLVAGHDDERAYVLLGLVEGGGGEWRPSPVWVQQLREAAAELGADTVLDVHLDVYSLRGIAARRRP
jgi:hypothetical protein